jgi:hypothetical protein
MRWFNDGKRNRPLPKLFARPSVEAVQVSLLARVFRTSDKDAPMRNDRAAVTRPWQSRLPADVIRRSPTQRRFLLWSDTIAECPAELRPIRCANIQRQLQAKRSSSQKKYLAIHAQSDAPESNDSSRDCEAKRVHPSLQQSNYDSHYGAKLSKFSSTATPNMS